MSLEVQIPACQEQVSSALLALSRALRELPIAAASVLIERFGCCPARNPLYEFSDGSPNAAGALLEFAVTKAGVPPVSFTLEQPRVPGGVAQRFIQFLMAQNGEKGTADKLDSLLPVPISQIGPAFVVAHFNPAFDFSAFLPRELCIPVWVTSSDYCSLRGSLREHYRDISVGGDLREAVMTPITPFATHINMHGGKPTLRLLLEWASALPTLSGGDEENVRALLSGDGEIIEGNLPSDFALLALHVLHHELVLKTPGLNVDRGLLDQLPANMREFQLCPLAVTDDLCVLLSGIALDDRLADAFSNRSSLRPVIIRISPSEFQALCAARIGESIHIVNEAEIQDAENAAISLDPSAFINGEAPADLTTNPETCLRFILWQAVTDRASDIHIEPYRNVYRARFTVDGVTRVGPQLPISTHDLLSTRIMDTSKIRLESIGAAHGRFLLTYGSRRIDVRVQMLADFREQRRFILRLLDKSAVHTRVSELGLRAPEQAKLQRAYREKDGILFVCGATGAGKSTTNFCIINELNTPANVIYSLEDPVEYEIPGVTQIRCTSHEEEERSNLPTFANAVPLLLRSAPTHIAIGEVRTRNTAEVALHAALTGHFVLTTFHADNVFSAIVRLLEMQLKATDFSRTTRAICCQRLVRKVCSCHALVSISPSDALVFNEAQVVIPPRVTRIPVAKGCALCRNTGYSGRFLVLEQLDITPEVSAAIEAFGRDHTKIGLIHQAAEKQSFSSVKHNALIRVLQGDTTLIEVDRAVERFERASNKTAETKPAFKAA